MATPSFQHRLDADLEPQQRPESSCGCLLHQLHRQASPDSFAAPEAAATIDFADAALAGDEDDAVPGRLRRAGPSLGGRALAAHSGVRDDSGGAAGGCRVRSVPVGRPAALTCGKPRSGLGVMPRNGARPRPHDRAAVTLGSRSGQPPPPRSCKAPMARAAEPQHLGQHPRRCGPQQPGRARWARARSPLCREPSRRRCAGDAGVSRVSNTRL